ncbi:purine permease [Pseudomonas tolaasii]|uniref:Purine permease n=2 Tax=Pseudomonas tolaasii TaxID=29442 RepID=A0A7Y8ATN5_PSETO|nr:nucleobase:cation symporter-2 family protein [Pseudomonas tolaasii]ARB31648.1 xanthine permease XanP [Pseudomonas tolaasii]KAB0474607.1 purine permease [Pseudomonas tolaasii]MBW1248393.1 purine permease [Pseudomonas tolaasii]MBW4796041.1 purine permease [Pseudomonas tolaasii]MBY8939974.1 purine permease [Pseudomonas tolaasii]
MPPESTRSSDLIYGLNDRPKPIPALLAALQHVLAAFVGIITPPLIIGSTLGLTAHLPYLISMALMVSGVGTFIQARRPFGIGAGMICLQGTSFAFLGAVLSAGFLVKQRGGNPEDIMAMIFGVCFFGAAVQIVLSRFIGQLRRVITPLVTGIVITLIGISLIKVGITDLGGGFNAPDFGAPINLALGVFVVLTIILLNRSNTPWVRLSAIIIGLAVGSLAAWFSGKLVPQALPDLPLISVPIPFRFGFNFDWSAFLPIALIYLISSIETVGDLTANCMIARQPISGPSYISRLKGGVLGDGVSCMVAATFSAFPNTTFAQNNGVIQLTGVASRYVGLYIGVLLFCLGLFPLIGAVLQQIPKPVLGGATLVMFGSVAAAGVRILAQAPLDRRSMLIIATSFGVGLGIAAQPDLLHLMPSLVQNLFDSAITSGGLTAIVLCLLLPEARTTHDAANHAPKSDTLEPL